MGQGPHSNLPAPSRTRNSPLTSVYVTTTFVAFHNWPGAPVKVEFLRHLHRHVFHVRVEVDVSHSDRDVEFFIFKELVDGLCILHFHGNRLIGISCEMIASTLANMLAAEGYTMRSVEVSEDGENGAILRYQ